MIPYLRFLSGEERSRDSNRHLGLTLAFVAGAVNAGGYVAVSRYTSHMTGIVASISNQLALGEYRLAAGGLAAYVSFLGGAATSAILINWARRRKRHSRYALPLMIEAFLLLAFGLLGANRPLPAGLLVPATVLLLCYTMGLQNAVITKISGAEIRTTHVTGLTTDLGIELGKLLFWNGDAPAEDRVLANREKLKLQASLLALFLFGGILGTLAFKRVGFVSTLPLAVLLFLVAMVPVWDDVSGGLAARG
jgi:uncharacterized membrane protein YoaK (UPF0700 family)